MHKFLALVSAAIFCTSTTLAHAGGCPENPDALGTSRELQVVAAGHAPIGAVQYRETLPLADHEVVLTFDDGPKPRTTGRILDTLASECVKATFFVVGEMASHAPNMVRRAFDEGHSIGSHTQHHPFNMHRLPYERMKKEIDEGVASVGAALGGADKVAPFFRVPGLARGKLIESHANSRGLMLWSIDIDSDDWTRLSPAGVVAHTISQLRRKGSGVILMHDIHDRTVAALPDLLRQLKAEGFRVVHVKPAREEEPKTAANDEGRRELSWLFFWE